MSRHFSLILLCAMILPTTTALAIPPQLDEMTGELAGSFAGMKALRFVPGERDCELTAALSRLTRYDCIVSGGELTLGDVDGGESLRIPLDSAIVFSKLWQDEWYYDYVYHGVAPASEVFLEPTAVTFRIWFFRDLPREVHGTFGVPSFGVDEEVLLDP